MFTVFKKIVSKALTKITPKSFSKIGLVFGITTGAIVSSCLVASAAEFPVGTFRLGPANSQDLVIDQYGSKITSSKAKAHLYQTSQTTTTSTLVKNNQTESGSAEIALSSDRNVCLGPDVGLNVNAIRHGTPVVFKRDCANTLNLILSDAGEIKVARMPKWCLDVVNGNNQSFTPIHIVLCSKNTAQLFKVREVPDNSTVLRASCFRKANDWFGKSQGCFFNNRKSGKYLLFENGNPANVWVKFTKPTIQASGGIGEEVYIEKIGELSPNSPSVQLPTNTVDYTIYPWNVGGTTNFLLKY